MNLVSALMVIALSSLLIFGFYQAEHHRLERKMEEATAEALIALQKAVLRWQTELMDETHPVAWDPTPSSSEVDGLLSYLPLGSFEGETPELISGSSPYLISGFSHGGGDTFELDFASDGGSVAINLINPSGWEERHVRHAQQRLPVIVRTTATELQLTVRHPSSQPLMSGTMRRYQTTDATGAERQGLVSPISFEDTSFAVAHTPCGTLGSVSVQADGLPIACIEHSPGVREWETLISSALICRDLRLPSTHADYNKHTPNMEIVVHPDWTQEVIAARSRTLRVPSIQLNTTPITTTCPRGFVLDSDPNYCTAVATD